MGITGLLPLLKGITTSVNVKEYTGKKVAVDTYVWLHKGSYNCSSELCQGIPSDKYVDYCMYRVNLLKYCGVIPVMVFDGRNLPAKRHTEASRYKSRIEHQQKGLQCLKENKTKEAREHFQKAVEISPDVAYRLIAISKRLKAENVEFIVAPYEADAQLAYLSINELVHAIITEDSDLLVYGCQRVLFKMDKYGNGDEILYHRLGECTSPVDFTGFNPKLFRQMAILSGCDYLASIPGLGLKKAHRYIKLYGTAAKVIQFLRNNGSDVLHNYDILFKQAELTFLHQRVWDPVRKALVHLFPLPEALQSIPDSELMFLGEKLSQLDAKQIAEGIIHPDTKNIYAAPLPAGRRPSSVPRAKNLSMQKPPPTNARIEQFFTPKPVSNVEVSRRMNLTNSVNASPYFTRTMPRPTFMGNRSSSSPALKLPDRFSGKANLRSSFAKAVVIPSRMSKIKAVPFVIEDDDIPDTDLSIINIVAEKENCILKVTSKYFPSYKTQLCTKKTPAGISNLNSTSTSSPTISMHSKFRMFNKMK